MVQGRCRIDGEADLRELDRQIATDSGLGCDTDGFDVVAGGDQRRLPCDDALSQMIDRYR